MVFLAFLMAAPQCLVAMIADKCYFFKATLFSGNTFLFLYVIHAHINYMHTLKIHIDTRVYANKHLNIDI